VGGSGHGTHNALQVDEGETFFDDEARTQVQGLRPHHGHIVDRAMHREATHIAAWEKQGRHHMTIGGHHQTALRCGGQWQHSGIIALTQISVVQLGQEQFFNQLRRCFAARAVAHVDASVFDVERTNVIFLHAEVTATSLKRP